MLLQTPTHSSKFCGFLWLAKPFLWHTQLCLSVHYQGSCLKFYCSAINAHISPIHLNVSTKWLRAPWIFFQGKSCHLIKSTAYRISHIIVLNNRTNIFLQLQSAWKLSPSSSPPSHHTTPTPPPSPPRPHPPPPHSHPAAFDALDIACNLALYHGHLYHCHRTPLFVQYRGLCPLSD